MNLVVILVSKCHCGEQIRKNEMGKPRAVYVRQMPTEFWSETQKLINQLGVKLLLVLWDQNE